MRGNRETQPTALEALVDLRGRCVSTGFAFLTRLRLEDISARVTVGEERRGEGGRGVNEEWPWRLRTTRRI